MEGISWAVIVGSIRLAGSAQFSEHYLAVSHCGMFGQGAGASRLRTVNAFPTDAVLAIGGRRLR
eukprot:CAMPEP_0172164028 /NCGR_PEP_ID=MMETSP1050-20130122/7611_1 /TAXON_ID=233186 /ORGANISM="Cryptomonas curvata, Strain CCAP979/52" /LENGTH=63 /DNA_ID=CAMNT_0012834307 /DNA_START=411 /DNA_END=598 /DNA_ORIENTATION=+